MGDDRLSHEKRLYIVNFLNGFDNDIEDIKNTFFVYSRCGDEEEDAPRDNSNVARMNVKSERNPTHGVFLRQITGSPQLQVVNFKGYK